MSNYDEGSYGQEAYGYADPIMVRIALEQLEKSEDKLDHKLHVYIEALDFQAQGANFLTKPPTPIKALDEIFSDIIERDELRGYLRKWSDGVSSFFLIVLDELRTIICGKGKTPKKLGTNSQAVLTALAAALAHKLGLDQPTAIGIAVLMLMTLGQATKRAFCKMADLEVLKALGR